MVTDFGDGWESVINAIKDFAPSVAIDPDQVVAGSYTTMTINAPAVVVYLEPSNLLSDEANALIDSRATCICFVLVESLDTEQATISYGVDLARAIMLHLQELDYPFVQMDVGISPIKIDDVYATHAVITMTFTIPL